MRRVNALRPNPFVRSVLPAFRLVANLEALSWAGLLVGMALKYGVAAGADVEIELVTLFGRLHGGLVIAYAGLAVAAAWIGRWNVRTTALALAATVPPFATVVFDLWAHRSGLYAASSRRRSS